MKFGFFTSLYLFAVISRPLNDHSMGERYIDNFVVAFYDYKALDSWLKIQNLKDETIKNFLKKMILDIRDIISELNADNAETLTDLIDKTNVVMDSNENPLYDVNSVGVESYVMIRSIIRILTKNGIDKKKKNRKFLKNFCHEKYVLGNEIVFEEFNLLYLDFCEACLQLLESPKTNESNNNTNENIIIKQQDFLEGVFPTDEKVFVYVLKSSEEISLSKKAIHSSMNLYMRNEYTLFRPNVQHMYELPKINTYKNEEQKNPSLKFKHKKSFTKLLLLLIHINSIYNSKEVIYRIEKLDDDFYEVECSTPMIPSLNDIKEHYMKKDIEDCGKVKLYNAFTLIDGSTDSYSLINDDETENAPIEERLMVLSCGHPMGLSLIDDFFEYCYKNTDKDLECHLCRIPVKILGSFDSIIYKKIDN